MTPSMLSHDMVCRDVTYSAWNKSYDTCTWHTYTFRMLLFSASCSAFLFETFAVCFRKDAFCQKNILWQNAITPKSGKVVFQQCCKSNCWNALQNHAKNYKNLWSRKVAFWNKKDKKKKPNFQAKQKSNNLEVVGIAYDMWHVTNDRWHMKYGMMWYERVWHFLTWHA